MQTPFEFMIGLTYTRQGRKGRRRDGFMSFISGISVASIALGVAALIIVLSVMNGFQKEVRDRMLSVIPHIEVTAVPGPLRDADGLARKLRDMGMHFAYHNHAFEFKKYNGRRIIDMLVEDTDPELFGFIMDTYWVQYGGGNPADFIRRLSGRMKVCHFKDYKIDSENKPDFAEIGTGNLDLDECYRACRESGVGYIVIEQDTCDIDPRESMAISYKNLIDIAKRNS